MADLDSILSPIFIALIIFFLAVCIISFVMSTAYDNLKKHLQLAIRQLKEILNTEKDFNEKELQSDHGSVRAKGARTVMNPTEIKAALEGILKATGGVQGMRVRAHVRVYLRLL